MRLHRPRISPGRDSATRSSFGSTRASRSLPWKVWVTPPAAAAEQDQTSNLLGPLAVRLEHHLASHRVTDEHHRAVAQVPTDAPQIVGVRRGADALGIDRASPSGRDHGSSSGKAASRRRDLPRGTSRCSRRNRSHRTGSPLGQSPVDRTCGAAPLGHEGSLSNIEPRAVRGIGERLDNRSSHGKVRRFAPDLRPRGCHPRWGVA